MKAKQIRKRVRKALRAVRHRPDEEAVHGLRTGLRRCEALSGKLPKRLRRLRKESGRVRDLDVLRQLVGRLELQQQESRSADLLLEHIDDARSREAKQLRKAAKRQRSGRLRRWANANVRNAKEDVANLQQEAEGLLANPFFANLDERNLHEFRLRLKPLRYRAEMASGEEAQRISERLNRLQTAIGDWHDLQLLADFARETLGESAGPLLTAIERATQQRLRAALDEAQRQRTSIAA